MPHAPLLSLLRESILFLDAEACVLCMPNLLVTHFDSSLSFRMRIQIIIFDKAPEEKRTCSFAQIWSIPIKNARAWDKPSVGARKGNVIEEKYGLG
jgi:hypothetical protein